MATEPTPGDDVSPSTDEPSADLLAAVGTDRGEEDFWTEAEGARHTGFGAKGRPHRPRRARPSTSTSPSATTSAAGAVAGGGSLRHRAAAAIAAESSARRVLRGGPVVAGAPDPRSRRRKVAAVAGVGAAAVLALTVAVADPTPPGSDPDGGTDELAGAEPAAASDDADRWDGGTSSREQASRDLVPVRANPEVRTASRPRTPAPGATEQADATGAPEPSSAPSAPPSPAAPPTGAPSPPPATPTTAPPPAPTPTAPTPTTATPTTAAPTPARVDAFTAQTALLPGGDCGTTQWATTLTWATTHATGVEITGLLAPAQRNLPADGARTVCRAVPGPPVGGWTLTATGPGGSATDRA